MEKLNPDWLKQLAPAHAPQAPGWWPLAPGWWALMAISLLLAAGLIYWYRRSSRKLRRAALRELRQMETRARDDKQLAGDLQDLLRRYAVAVYGRETVAKLSGEDWLAFVVAHGGEELAGEAGQGLLRAAYGSRLPNNRTPWLDGARGFLRGRR